MKLVFFCVPISTFLVFNSVLSLAIRKRFTIFCNCGMHSTIFGNTQQYYILVGCLVGDDVRVILITKEIIFKVVLDMKCIMYY